MRKWTKSFAIVLSVGLAALAAATPSGGVTTAQIASKEAQARAALARQDQIAMQMAPAQEAWNAAKAKRQAVEADIALNKHQIAITKANVAADKKMLSDLLAQQYEQGTLDPVVAMLAAGSLQDMIDAADIVQRSSSQAATILKRLAAEQRDLQARERTLEADRQKAAAYEQQMASKYQQVQALHAQWVQAAAGLQAQVAQLRAQRKQEIVAAAQAAKAQAAQQAAAAQATQTDPGIGGSASSGGSTGAGQTVPPPSPSGGAATAVAAALSQVGVPYVWGAASPGVGFDCSGLTMWAWGQAGVSMGHYTGSQYAAFPKVSESDLQPGDLVFFDGLGHVGMYIGGGQFVHAPHTGTVVQISSLGGWYQSHYDGAVRPG